jgi:hypothetical protein
MFDDGQSQACAFGCAARFCSVETLKHPLLVYMGDARTRIHNPKFGAATGLSHGDGNDSPRRTELQRIVEKVSEGLFQKQGKDRPADRITSFHFEADLSFFGSRPISLNHRSGEFSEVDFAKFSFGGRTVFDP